MSGVFEIYKDKANEYRFRLKEKMGQKWDTFWEWDTIWGIFGGFNRTNKDLHYSNKVLKINELPYY